MAYRPEVLRRLAALGVAALAAGAAALVVTVLYALASGLADALRSLLAVAASAFAAWVARRAVADASTRNLAQAREGALLAALVTAVVAVMCLLDASLLARVPVAAAFAAVMVLAIVVDLLVAHAASRVDG